MEEEQSNINLQPLPLGYENVLPAQLPVRYENRQATDFKWLILYGVVMAVLIPFSIYALATSNLSNIFHGVYSSAGNDSSYESTFQPPTKHPEIKWGKIVGMAFATIALSLTVMLLYRYATAVVVWGTLILCLIVLGILSIMFWIAHSETDDDRKATFTIIAVVATLLLFLLIITLILCSKKIKLIIILHNETSKCVFDMPFITTIPIVTFFVQAAFIALLYVIIVWLIMERINAFVIFLSTFVMLWTLQITYGCQYMTVAGAASTWYFAREKRHPILTSLKNMFRYHLGTIALGSLILLLVTALKKLLKTFIRIKAIKECIESMMGTLEKFLKFLSKNAYVETAIHGHEFMASGKRAAGLLFDNLGDALAINFVSDLVIALSRVLIIAIASGISYPVFAQDTMASSEMGISTGVSVFIVWCFFGVFETVIDSLFICYCEDITMNDGNERPYHMSANLKRLFDDMKSKYGDGALPTVARV